jgi:NAD(P)-dependent dehydrogenase (short-subunit alcohol dehydrogenase family)
VARAVESFGQAGCDLQQRRASRAARRCSDHDPEVGLLPDDPHRPGRRLLRHPRRRPAVPRPRAPVGVIISTSSIYGEQAAELAFTYSAAKAAVISFTRSAAYELAEYGVRAVAITPGRDGNGHHQPFQRTI